MFFSFLWSPLEKVDLSHPETFAFFVAGVAPAAARLGGRIVDVLGDGTLAEFAEVSAALDWARTLHAAAAEAAEAEPEALPITFRIAIHRGTVMADGARILGDAVNLAARLQEYGTPGGTLGISRKPGLIARSAGRNPGGKSDDPGEAQHEGLVHWFVPV